jgi:hypothetical protein
MRYPAEKRSVHAVETRWAVRSEETVREGRIAA